MATERIGFFVIGLTRHVLGCAPLSTGGSSGEVGQARWRNDENRRRRLGTAGISGTLTSPTGMCWRCVPRPAVTKGHAACCAAVRPRLPARSPGRTRQVWFPNNRFLRELGIRQPDSQVQRAPFPVAPNYHTHAPTRAHRETVRQPGHTRIHVRPPARARAPACFLGPASSSG